MTYANEGVDQRAEVAQGATDTLAYWPKVDGKDAAVDPGTAFVTIADPNGGELVARSPATIGVDGRLSLSQTWPVAPYVLAEDFRAIWEWQTGGLPYADRQSFDVVKRKLTIRISPRDLVDEYPTILESLASVIPEGVTPEEVAARACRSAWSELLDRIRAAGKRPSLIMDRERLVNPAKHLALAYVARVLTLNPGDLWDDRRKSHADTFKVLWSGLGSLRYDVDESDTTGPLETRPIRRRFFAP